MMMNDDISNDWWTWSSVEVDDELVVINLTSEVDKMSSSNGTSTVAELAAQVAIGTLLSTLCLITVLGNTLVIHAVRTDRKLQTVSAAH